LEECNNSFNERDSNANRINQMEELENETKRDLQEESKKSDCDSNKVEVEIEIEHGEDVELVEEIHSKEVEEEVEGDDEHDDDDEGGLHFGAPINFESKEKVKETVKCVDDFIDFAGEDNLDEEDGRASIIDDIDNSENNLDDLKYNKQEEQEKENRELLDDIESKAITDNYKSKSFIIFKYI